MRRGCSYLILLLVLTSCSNPQQIAEVKCDRKVSPTAREHRKKPDIQAFLCRLFGKMLYIGKGCDSIAIPSDSLFEPHSDKVKPTNWAAPIDTVAAICKRYPETELIVSAYTDCLRSEEQNIALSDLQARMVKRALVDKGVASRRITAKGWGESRPVASNATREGRKANRRIRISFCPDRALLEQVNLEQESRKTGQQEKNKGGTRPSLVIPVYRLLDPLIWPVDKEANFTLNPQPNDFKGYLPIAPRK